jgi:sn-glycerol 3-phosphate transport system permease protein
MAERIGEKRKHKAQGSGIKNYNPLSPYLMLLPATCGLALFVVYPLVYLFRASFTNRSLLKPIAKFVGLANYIELFNSVEFLSVIKNSILYAFLFVSFSIIFALLFAVWLNKSGRIWSFAQSAIFIPYIVSFVTISLVWLWLMEPQDGLLNTLLGALGVSYPWLSDTKSVIPSLVLVSVWKYVGYYMLLLIAALQNIPRDIYEAVKIDGARARTVFFRITLPLITPSLFFILVVSTTEALRIFDPINIMTQGGPINASSVFVYFIYEYAFKYFRIGYASAAGVILFLIIGVLVGIYFNMLGKRVHYQ